MIFEIVSTLGNIDFKIFHSSNEIYLTKHKCYGIQDMIYFVRINLMLRILQTMFWYINVPIEGPDQKMVIFLTYHLSPTK